MSVDSSARHRFVPNGRVMRSTRSVHGCTQTGRPSSHSTCWAGDGTTLSSATALTPCKFGQVDVDHGGSGWLVTVVCFLHGGRDVIHWNEFNDVA